MSSVFKRSRRQLACLAALPPLLLASTARADDTPPPSLAAFAQSAAMHVPCDDTTIENPFTAWDDGADYFLNRQGDLADGATEWTLDGATIATEDNAYTTHVGDVAASLSLTEGESATAPTACVSIDDPTMRFFVKNTGAETGTLKVEVTYNDENWDEHTTTLATLTSEDAGDAWTPSPVIDLAAPLVELLDAGQTPVNFKFTAEGEDSAWLVDDVYVDPYGKG
jgi:hypothetical protein